MGGIVQLFVNESFIGHAGPKLPFKIECDALSEDDLKTLAEVIARKYRFRKVFGVPRGGLRLARALEKHCISRGGILIVDDVLTTGKSMEDMRRQLGRTNVRGIVIFARGKCPSWVNPMFQLSEWARP